MKFGLFLIVVFLLVMALFGWLAVSRYQSEDACEARGGIPVKSQLGPLYCFDRDVLLDE